MIRLRQREKSPPGRMQLLGMEMALENRVHYCDRARKHISVLCSPLICRLLVGVGVELAFTGWQASDDKGAAVVLTAQPGREPCQSAAISPAGKSVSLEN